MSADEREHENRWLALYVLCAGVLMIVLDATVVNVALPSIKDDLDFTQSDLAWVVNAYLIAFGGLLLLAGRLGDLIGHRRVFLRGSAVFTVASLLCGLAQSQAMLIGARFLQGAGGAAASAVTLGMIVTMFPEPREQAKAIGVYGFVASAGGSIGLLAGGVLTDLINWHWIFFVNVPIGLVTALLAIRLVEGRPGIGLSEGADVPGAVLVTGRPDAGGLHDPRRGGERLDLRRDAHPGGGLDRPGRGLRAAPGAHREAADAASAVPLAQRLGREHRDGAARGRHVRHLLPRRAVPAARARLRARSRSGLAFLPGSLLMGLLSLGFTDKLNMRFGPRNVLITGLGLPARGDAAVRADAGGRQLPDRPVPDDDHLRRRRGRCLPRPDDARDVGRHAE